MSLILYFFQDSSNSGGRPLVIFHPFAAKVIWCCRYVHTETLKYNENHSPESSTKSMYVTVEAPRMTLDDEKCHHGRKVFF